jgi:alkaline phosphatase
MLSCQSISYESGEEKSKTAKNVILLIGDGMGTGHISAALYANNNKLNLEQFKYIGFHKTYSYDNLITDSGAAGTALSSGTKTYNGAIGVDPDTLPVSTILEIAEQHGLATGLVSTSTITHATPASFIAHQPSRKMYEEIAADFLQTEIDYFVGGGLEHFLSRNDSLNLLDSLVARGYLVSDSMKQAFEDFLPQPDKNYAYLTAKGSPVKFSDGRKYLELATSRGIDFLDKHTEKGFFLMVEASQIDWGGHDNDYSYVLDEMLEFDRVIDIAYQFAKKDGNTLVIVTADHETGGMTINSGSTIDSLKFAFTSGSHTADLIPVFAFGPGAKQFGGIYENTAIFDKMKAAFGW